MATKSIKKNKDSFDCVVCDYSTSYKCNYNKHIVTPKHVMATNSNKSQQKVSESISDSSDNNACKICGKKYQNRSGLWRHKKKCGIIQCKEDLNDQKKQQQLVDYLMKENSEFKQLMIDQNKQMMDQNKQMMDLAKNSGNHNNNTINTNNNNFNLQFFLNETCKDAMNIMEFVDQLQVSVKDLEETGRLGYSEGISKIFINGLKQINISDRPIHCADSKREIVYIKDKNQWNKEDDNKSLLTNAIKHVAHKNMRQIKEWTKVNPEYNDSSSKQNDRYLKIVSNSMNGSTEEETIKNYNKIIKNITKETVIEK
jgi:hypothetical protein